MAWRSNPSNRPTIRSVPTRKISRSSSAVVRRRCRGRAHSPAANTAVTDQPAELVRQLIGPFLRQFGLAPPVGNDVASRDLRDRRKSTLPRGAPAWAGRAARPGRNRSGLSPRRSHGSSSRSGGPGVQRSTMPLLNSNRTISFVPVIMNCFGVVSSIRSAGRRGWWRRGCRRRSSHLPRPVDQLVEPDQALVGVDKRVAGEARVGRSDPAGLGVRCASR